MKRRYTAIGAKARLAPIRSRTRSGAVTRLRTTLPAPRAFAASPSPRFTGTELLETALEQPRQLAIDGEVTKVGDSPFCGNDDIDRLLQSLGVLAPGLSDPALDAISNNSVANLFRDGDPKATVCCRRDPETDNQPAPVKARAAFAYPQKVASFFETMRGREAAAGLCQRVVVRSYFLGTDTARRLRPLRRRAAITLRPPGVAVRERNPCLLRRLRLLG